MPGGAVCHDHPLVHVCELVGGDVDDQAGFLQPGVGLAFLGTEHIVEMPKALLLKELRQEQGGVAAAEIGRASCRERV